MSEQDDKTAAAPGRKGKKGKPERTEPRLHSEPTPESEANPTPGNAVDPQSDSGDQPQTEAESRAGTEAAVADSPEPEPGAAPEAPAAATSAEPAAPPQTAAAPPGRGATPLAVLALLLALAAGAAAYYLWVNLQVLQERQDTALESMQAQQETILEATQSRLESAIEARSARLEQNLSGETAAMRQTVEALQAEQNALGSRQDELQTALRNALDRIGQRRDGWLAAEAGYLLRIASQRLELARDPATARSALEAADRRLRETGDSAFMPVRQSIANQIRALEAVEVPDVAGMSARLSSLSDSVETLSLRGEFATPSQAPTADPGERPPVDLTSAEGWRNFAARLWEDIRGLVTIRHDGASTKPLLPPEHRYYLRQNLRLQLEQAQLALLQSEPSVYTQSLEQAQAWVREYYAVDTQPVSSLLESLEQLAGRSVTAELPDISEPVRVLDRVREKLSEENRAAARGQGGGAQ